MTVSKAQTSYVHITGHMTFAIFSKTGVDIVPLCGKPSQCSHFISIVTQAVSSPVKINVILCQLQIP